MVHVEEVGSDSDVGVELGSGSEEEESGEDEAQQQSQRDAGKVGISAEELSKQNAQLEASKQEERDRVQKQFTLSDACRIQGNSLLTKGDFENACLKYDEGLRALELVGNEPENRQRFEKEAVILHANMALAYLRRGHFARAKSHATDALTTDSCCVKALYRRALAQARLANEALLYQDGEAQAACADLEAVLRLEPENGEAQKELQRLRKEIQKHKNDLAKAQKKTWEKVFGGKTIVEGETEVVEEPLPAVRSCNNKSRRLCVSLEGVSVKHIRGDATLDALDLELREGWCIGLWASTPSRAALIKVLTQKFRGYSGKVLFHPNKPSTGNREPPSLSIPMIISAVCVLASSVAHAMSELPTWLSLSMAVATSLSLFVLWALWQDKRGLQPSVVLMTSQSSEIDGLSPKATIEELIGAPLPQKLTKAERRARVVSMLRAAGFQRFKQETRNASPEPYNEPEMPACTPEPFGNPAEYIQNGLRYGELNEAEKRLVYVLRCLAMRPTVLVCDEPFVSLPGGLYELWWPRVLRMLKRMKQDCKTSILFLSTDLTQMRVVSDSLGVLSKGTLCELGPTEEVVEGPRSNEMKDLLEPLRKGINVFRDRCQFLIRDEGLNLKWLPNVQGEVPSFSDN